MSSDAGDEGIDLFQEPADFYEPEKQATFASHHLVSGEELTVRLVGHNPLWVSCSLYRSSGFLAYRFFSLLLLSFDPLSRARSSREN
jgi:hypothetical protein